ncbi:carbohydrate ABC transporter permease [Schleiferilactobacillus shenzhenensis]|uniref:ABC transmembrane type-1 domain-containing protein n=1 Tax=Schleiferilactobacillus shenzhenensis LY-73 TaxID=1231336 RepID=U4TNJ6_9LACO|nr:carbohydrate ABC transporter permease [Schleiferilactobacillus shenzhenensis]ERL65789.1 hypothetical protein L248_1865 [Schleiferilactobacillus shenzhenensis LY-73]
MKYAKRTIHYVLLILIALLVMAPLLLGIWASLLPTTDIVAGHFNSLNISLNNYVAAIQTTPVVLYMWNSLVISSLIMVGQLIFCTLAAYAFAFLQFRFKNGIFFAFLITMMLPFEAQIIPNFQTVRALGWLDSYPGLTIPFFTSAFGVFMLRQAFLQVPRELKEYSDLIGLGRLQFLTRIVLPYTRSTIITFVLYTFLTHWNAYLWPLITTFSDAHRPTQVGLKQLQSEDTFNNWGVIMATAIMVLLPTLLILIIGQRYFRKGLNAGGVKG